MAIGQIFGPDSDYYKNPSKKMADSRGFFFWRIPDSSNILKGVKKYYKNVSATYVLKNNVLGVLYNSLPRIEPDFKRYYI